MGAATHDGEGLEAGHRARANDGAVGGQLAEPAARDAEAREDLVVEVAAAGGEQAGRRGDRARPSDDPGEPVSKIVGQEERGGHAAGGLGVLAQVGEQLVRGVNGRGLIAGQVEKLAVRDTLTESVKGARRALVTVGDDVANEASILVEGGPIHAPRIDRDRAGVRELLESLHQAVDRLGLHRRHVPRQRPVLAAAGLVLEAVNVRDFQAAVSESSGENSPGRGSKVNSKYGGH